MRKEHGYFDKTEKCLVITDSKKDRVWYCSSWYKTFADGVHQQEIWYAIGDNETWTLGGADENDLVCSYEENGWNEGFYYSCSDPTAKRHSAICISKGQGSERELLIRKIEIAE